MPNRIRCVAADSDKPSQFSQARGHVLGIFRIILDDQAATHVISMA
jgi:hypothetical protein